jgi:molecular chaperone GrpE
MSENDGKIHVHDEEDAQNGSTASRLSDDIGDAVSSAHEHGKADRRAVRDMARDIGAQMMDSAKDFTGKMADVTSKATKEASDRATKAADRMGGTAGKAAAAAGKAAQATADIAGEAAKGAADAAAKAAAAAADANDKAADAVDAATDKLLAKAQADAKDWQDRFLRLHAEWDTYRRRTGEQREQERKEASENIVKDILPVMDDFERSIEYAVKNGSDDLLEGVKKVHAKMEDVLTSNGVEVIDPKGEQFDALQEQAVAKIEKADVPEETVDQVYQKGYKMGKKVIRPATVTVTTGGPKPPKKKDGDEKKDDSSEDKE